MTNLISLGEQREARELISIPTGERRSQPLSPREVDRDATFFASATGRPVAETAGLIESGQTATLQAETNASSNTAVANQVQGFLDLPEEEQTQALENTINELREVEMFSRFLPESMSAALRANANGSREFALDRISRLVYTGEQIQRRVEEMGGGVATAVDVGEIILDPFSFFYQQRYESLVERFEALLAPGVTPQEFEQGLETILTEAADAGFFSNENRFYFGGFLDTLASGIYSNDAAVAELFGVLDLGLTFGGPAAGATGAVARNGLTATATLAGSTAITTGVVARNGATAVLDAGRDYLSAFNIITPSNRSQEVIQETLSRNITLDVAEGMTPTAHTHTSIMTPTIVRAGHLTAPEHTAARNFELASEGLAELREVAQASGRVFDDETIQAFATQFASDRRVHLQATGQSRIIDVDVAVDEFNNIYFLDLLGTTRGQGFRSERAAQAAAGYGDEVGQMVNGDWIVIRRGNISADNLERLPELGYTADLQGLMLYRATDPDSLGHGFWAHWGSPLAQADPLTSSNLFRAEGVMQRAMHQIRARTKTVMRTMTSRQVSEVYQAFEAMARMPQRNAFTREQFVDWFSTTYSREPTEAQQALYLLQQERLDAELFATANEVYRRAVDMGARTTRIDGEEYTTTVARRPDIEDNAFAVDVDNGGTVRISDLPEDVVIYRNVGNKELPGNLQYFFGTNIESRAVRHSDFLARNSGGHRAYLVNEMQFLVKQPSTTTYADGTTRQSSPATLLGARTREEAQRAVEDVHRIMDELHDAVPVGRNSADDYLDALEGASNMRRLNDAVRANNGFNPVDIQDVQSLVNFARDRGLDLRTRFRVVAEGDQLGDMARLGDNAFLSPNRTQADDVRMNMVRGGRGSLPLTRYGGGEITQRSVQDTLEGAYASTVARMTEAAYRIRAGKGLIKGAIDSGVMKKEFNQYARAPLRTQLEAIKREGLIDTSGATGKDALTGRKFQLDLDRLLFRLQQQSAAQRIWNNVSRNLANYLYGKGFTWGTNLFDRWSTDPVTAFRGLAFDAYLGMFNVSQLLMQSVQVVNIFGIAGVKGMQGASLYGPMRFALNNQNPGVTQRLVRLLHGAVGITEEQFDDMIRMFRESGRGIVDNNVAEMTMAEDAGSAISRSQTIRSTREAGRVFFKEGDLVARITAFNTAYLEAVARFGSRTRANQNKFNRWVDWRQQVLTQGMTAASRQGYEQLPFMQFMSYQLRINEAIFAGTFSNSKTVLTTAEKLRLLSVHAAMFGAMSNTVTGVLSQYAEANYNIQADERLIRLAQRGLLDTILSELTGADTAASSRFSSSMGMYNILENLAREHPALVLGGPSIQFAGTLADTTFGVIYQGIQMAVTGNTQGFRTEIGEFARLTSSGNYTFNAMTAYRYGRYLTKRGGLVTEDLDAMDAVFLAFGIPLEEIDSIYSYLGQRRLTTGWLRHQANSITEMHNRAFEALRRGDNERYIYFRVSITEALAMLEPWEREQVERMVRDDASSLTNGFLIETLRRDVQAAEQIQ